MILIKLLSVTAPLACCGDGGGVALRHSAVGLLWRGCFGTDIDVGRKVI